MSTGFFWQHGIHFARKRGVCTDLSAAAGFSARNRFYWRSFFLLFLCLLAGTAFGQNFKATNAPGTNRDFTFKVKRGTTNISFILGGSPTAYSHLLLRKGAAP